MELVELVTRGDKLLDTPLAKIGGKGLFIKELELALLEQRADIAVHSLKDVPVELPAELCLATVLKRAEPRDALVSRHFDSLKQMPKASVIGTASLRRQCQLLALRPDLQIRSLRGNINTRLGKLDANEFDAIVLAAVGLMRLGLQSRIAGLLPIEQSLPAIGQGVIAIECRQGDREIESLLNPLQDSDTHAQIAAERALNKHLDGGCQVPLAGFAELQGNELVLNALVGSVDGREIIRAQGRRHRRYADQLGREVGDQLLAQGADRIMAALHSSDR